MTEAEREALVERMVLAGINARRALVGAPPRTMLLQENPTEVAAMRAALAVAERVVREDEREAYEVKQDKATLDTLNWCLNWLNVRANADKVLANAEAAFCARRDALQRDIDQQRAAIRARGAA